MSVAICFKHLRLFPLISTGRDSITVRRLESGMIQVTFCLHTKVEIF
jgi:hypothetical protein